MDVWLCHTTVKYNILCHSHANWTSRSITTKCTLTEFSTDHLSSLKVTTTSSVMERQKHCQKDGQDSHGPSSDPFQLGSWTCTPGRHASSCCIVGSAGMVWMCTLQIKLAWSFNHILYPQIMGSQCLIMIWVISIILAMCSILVIVGKWKCDFDMHFD